MTKKPSPIESAAGTGEFTNFLSRRGFMRSGAVAGAGLMLTSKGAIAQGESGDRLLKVGIVGCGAQGERLRDAASKLDGINFVAVCDIWPYNRQIMARRLKAYGHDAEEFDDYEAMLEKRTDLDAVLLPTPDVFHAPYTRMALEKGLAVYCEKMMSNTIEGAADMVRSQRETGGILQIGHQRRSNPRYLHLRDKLILDKKIFGRITHANAQWNRPVSAAPTSGYPKGSELPQETLEKYGFKSMEEFRNWRMSRKFGGGIVSDLGAHQIDIFNWFLEANPKSIIASGGVDYWTEYELPDNVMAIYEYELPEGTSRAYYQVLTTSGSQGYYEKFMGVNGTATISENPSVNTVYREAHADSWEEYGEEGLLAKVLPTGHHKFWQHPKPWQRPVAWLDKAADSTASKGLDPWEIPVQFNLPPHAPHLQNFFDAVRAGKDKGPDMLNCKVADAFQTCVTVLKVYEALESGDRINLTPEDFIVA